MNKKIALLSSTILGGILAAGMAQAADMPTPVYKAQPTPVAFSWTGFYIGAHVGAGWGTKEWNPDDVEGSYTINGFLGGGQIGYNWQTGWVVLGVEADASAAGLKGSGLCNFGNDGCTSRVDALGTITGRIGGTVDHALLYLKGGAAWVHDKHTDLFDGFSTASQTRWGWTVGGGIEYAFTSNWSGKLEYNYMDFGTRSVRFTGDDNFNVDLRQTIHAVKIGLNYRFQGPINARY